MLPLSRPALIPLPLPRTAALSSIWPIARAPLSAAAAAAAAASATSGGDAWRVNLTGKDETRLAGARDEKWWFTGMHPAKAPGFDGKVLRSIRQPMLNAVTRTQTQAYFDNSWSLYELLFAGLQGEEAFFRPPSHGLRHPMIFYYGHTAVLYINKLIVAGLLDKPIDGKFEKLFEVGVDEMRWDDLSDFKTVWPAVSEVTEYRREVHRLVSRVIGSSLSDSEPARVTMKDPLWSIYMACEHDRVHLETSAVLIRELPLRLVRSPELWPAPAEPSKRAESNPMVAVAGDEVALGKSKEFDSYGWDNEYGSRTVTVDAFQASRNLVSNAEFLEFVVAGGYHEPALWSAQGWEWRRFRNAKWPRFWVPDGPEASNRYRLRHVFKEGPMDAAAPVLVNRHEAQAYLQWKSAREGKPGLRLPTEAEHQLMLPSDQRHLALNQERNGRADPALSSFVGDDPKYNYNLAHGSETAPSPVNSQGFSDAMGNAWSWTQDAQTPLDGFAPHPFYPDFSEPCFDGEHYIISGGSFVSSGDAGANLFSRFHFRPHFLQFSSIRVVQPSAQGGDDGDKNREKPQTQSDYENAKSLGQYMALHYGQRPPLLQSTTLPVLPTSALDFPARVADLLIKHSKRFGAALDLGCAVGASSFRLADKFAQVEGLDFSAGFIKAAETVLGTGQAVFTLEDHAGQAKLLQCEVAAPKGALRFVVGDATKLPSSMDGRFDSVLMANLLCRLPDPRRVLDRLPMLLKDGKGVVLITSPFSWMESFTPRDKWIGGRRGVRSRDALVEAMKENGFVLKHEGEEALVIRDHERKFQFISAHAAVFERA